MIMLANCNRCFSGTERPIVRNVLPSESLPLPAGAPQFRFIQDISCVYYLCSYEWLHIWDFTGLQGSGVGCRQDVVAGFVAYLLLHFSAHRVHACPQNGDESSGGNSHSQITMYLPRF
jgi:hypothetical protein